jgi:hypothetical protein
MILIAGLVIELNIRLAETIENSKLYNLLSVFFCCVFEHQVFVKMGMLS